MKYGILIVLVAAIAGLAGCSEEYTTGDTFEDQVIENEDCEEDNAFCDIYLWQLVEGKLSLEGTASNEKEFVIRKVLIDGVPAAKSTNNFATFKVDLSLAYVDNKACEGVELQEDQVCVVCTVEHYCGREDFNIVLTDDAFAGNDVVGDDDDAGE